MHLDRYTSWYQVDSSLQWHRPKVPYTEELLLGGIVTHLLLRSCELEQAQLARLFTQSRTFLDTYTVNIEFDC